MSKSETHAGYSEHWWTPPEWIRWIQATIGIYYDPCPQQWDGVDSGLKGEWGSPVYVNHPGGERGAAQRWWSRTVEHSRETAGHMIWCAFNVEQLRYLNPSPFHLPGWLVMPRIRVRYIWGGDTIEPIVLPSGRMKAVRKHGEPCKSPANWSVFWTSAPPAIPPVDSIIVRTSQ